MKKVSFANMFIERSKQHNEDEMNIEAGTENPEKIARYKMILAQILVTSIVNLAFIEHSMVMGFPTIVIPELLNSTDHLTFTEEEATWFASIAEFVSLIGSASLWILFDKVGSKFVLTLVLVPHVIGWYTFYFANSTAALFVAEVISGLVIGIISASVSTYISEISCPELRGALVCYSAVSEKFGYFFVFFLGALSDWKMVACLSGLLPIITAILLIQVPDSPTWLISKGRLADAERSLCFLRGWVSPDEVRYELEQLTLSVRKDKHNNMVDYSDVPEIIYIVPDKDNGVTENINSRRLSTAIPMREMIRRKSLMVENAIQEEVHRRNVERANSIRMHERNSGLSKSDSLRIPIERSVILRDDSIRDRVRRAAILRGDSSRNSMRHVVILRGDSMKDKMRQSVLLRGDSFTNQSGPAIVIKRDSVRDPSKHVTIFRENSTRDEARRAALLRNDSVKDHLRHAAVYRNDSISDHPRHVVVRGDSTRDYIRPAIVSREHSARLNIRRVPISRGNSSRDQIRRITVSRGNSAIDQIKRVAVSRVNSVKFENKYPRNEIRRHSVARDHMLSDISNFTPDNTRKDERFRRRILREYSIKNIRRQIHMRQHPVKSDTRRSSLTSEALSKLRRKSLSVNTIGNERFSENTLKDKFDYDDVMSPSVSRNHSVRLNTSEPDALHNDSSNIQPNREHEPAENAGTRNLRRESLSPQNMHIEQTPFPQYPTFQTLPIIEGSTECSEETENKCKSTTDSLDSHKSLSTKRLLELAKLLCSESVRDIRKSETWRPLLLVLVYTTVNTFSGFQSIRPYLIHIFEKLHVPVDPKWTAVLYSTMGLFGVALSFTVVHWTGKRALSLTCVAVISVTCFLIGTYAYLHHIYDSFEDSLGTWFPLVLILVLHLAQCTGPKILTFLLANEVFPESTRTLAIIIINGYSYIIGFIGMKYYLEMEEYFHISGVFWFFGSVTFLGFVYLFFELYETQGKTLEEIKDHYGNLKTASAKMPITEE